MTELAKTTDTEKAAAVGESAVQRPVIPLYDGKWYWVRCEGISTVHEAPAMYKANVECFYSYEFAGIPLSHLTVLREA